MGPWFAMPRRLCVDIGPFSGRKSLLAEGIVNSIGFGLLRQDVVGVAEVPREAVEVAEHVARPQGDSPLLVVVRAS
jgi:hypothetical protein